MLRRRYQDVGRYFCEHAYLKNFNVVNNTEDLEVIHFLPSLIFDSRPVANAIKLFAAVSYDFS